MESLKQVYRVGRVALKKRLGIEPAIKTDVVTELEFHGNSYAGWNIKKNSLRNDSVVIDVGLGEDISFSESIIRKYGCIVYGFDPTPRAIKYVSALANPKVQLFELGLGKETGPAKFFLPNDAGHVSGALDPQKHLGSRVINVNLVSLADMIGRLRCTRIDLLKMDIEGAEYEIIATPDFRCAAPLIGQLCIEFHHRWTTAGKKRTEKAVEWLRELGFKCAWSSATTNEEYLFIRP